MSTSAGDKIDSLELRQLQESPELTERIVVDDQKVAVSDPKVRDLLASIYLQADRNGEFQRFRKSREFQTILKLLSIFKVTPDLRICEIGGGSGFLTWALKDAGFRNLSLFEPSNQYHTGTGYLRSREDAQQVRIYNGVEEWWNSGELYDVIISKNCIHHFPNIAHVAAMTRQRMAPGGRWIAIREWFAETPEELHLQLKNHPYCQRFNVYEWPFPAQHYVDAIEIVGFQLKAIVPSHYENNCMGTYSENPCSADVQKFTDFVDSTLKTSPSTTVEAFWSEVKQNKFEGGADRLFTAPQAMIFEKIKV
jgi:hypothetical protein